jgi:hypothetical protein
VKNAAPGIVIVSGASQTGKTTWTMRAAGSARRVIAWDPDAQWCTLPGWQRFDTAAAFAAAVMRSKAGPIRAALCAHPAADLKSLFEGFAEIAFTAVDKHGELAIVAEELADVSTPGKALKWWGALIRRGLKRGASIFAISQRWAEADKTAIGNSTAIVAFRSSSADDVRYLAKKTRINAADLDALRPYDFIAYDVKTHESQRGKVARRG